jgi:outer membrane protein TolC
VLQARVSLDAARRDRFTAAEASRVAVAAIALLLGRDPEAPVVLDGELATVAPITEPDSGFAAQAAGSDPELRRFAALSIQARREASLWRSRSRFPHFAVGPSYGWINNSRPFVSAVGFNFSIDLPLFHGREDEIEAANYDRAAAEAGHDARERQLKVLVLNATSTLSRAGLQLDSLRKGDLVRAAQAEGLAATALRQGGPYLTTWLTARQAYLDVRRAELQLEWQAARARLTLRYLTGTLRESPEDQGKGND